MVVRILKPFTPDGIECLEFWGCESNYTLTYIYVLFVQEVSVLNRQYRYIPTDILVCRYYWSILADHRFMCVCVYVVHYGLMFKKKKSVIYLDYNAERDA